MTDETLETLTSIEAKVLHLRYGIKNIDEHHSLNILRMRHGTHVAAKRSASEVAKSLGENTDLIEQTESNALRKLRVNS